MSTSSGNNSIFSAGQCCCVLDCYKAIFTFHYNVLGEGENGSFDLDFARLIIEIYDAEGNQLLSRVFGASESEDGYGGTVKISVIGTDGRFIDLYFEFTSTRYVNYEDDESQNTGRVISGKYKFGFASGEEGGWFCDPNNVEDDYFLYFSTSLPDGFISYKGPDAASGTSDPVEVTTCRKQYCGWASTGSGN